VRHRAGVARLGIISTPEPLRTPTPGLQSSPPAGVLRTTASPEVWSGNVRLGRLDTSGTGLFLVYEERQMIDVAGVLAGRTAPSPSRPGSGSMPPRHSSALLRPLSPRSDSTLPERLHHGSNVSLAVAAIHRPLKDVPGRSPRLERQPVNLPFRP
jgi:hypothetical protein